MHLPTLRGLAAEYGLEVVEAANFGDFFAREWRQHLPLLERMKVPEKHHLHSPLLLIGEALTLCLYSLAYQGPPCPCRGRWIRAFVRWLGHDMRCA